MDDAERWFRRGGELADRGGPAQTQALSLLRAAVAAGHKPALLRLAEFLTTQYSEADGRSHAEALRLLEAAVSSGVPGARNMLGLTLWDDGVLHRAEVALRAAVAEGDVNAPVNLASLLYQQGADAEAFALLRQAAERGDGVAYQIVMRSLPPSGRTAEEVTSAYMSASRPEDRPVCVRMPDWHFDPSVLPAD